MRIQSKQVTTTPFFVNQHTILFQNVESRTTSQQAVASCANHSVLPQLLFPICTAAKISRVKHQSCRFVWLLELWDLSIVPLNIHPLGAKNVCNQLRHASPPRSPLSQSPSPASWPLESPFPWRLSVVGIL
jgi:hypothetical protein